MGYSYNTTSKQVTVTATSTARALHDDIQTTFAGSTYMQYLIPNSGSIKDALYIFQNGWTFADTTSRDYMTTGGWQSSDGNEKWTNLKGISGDDFTGIQTYIGQNGSVTNAVATGLPNQLLSVRTGGTDIDSQTYTLYQRTQGYQYSQFSTTASSGGVDTIPLTLKADSLITIDDSTLSGYSDLTITWGTFSKDAGDGAGAKTYNISIVTTNSSRTLAEIYNWVQYQLRQGTDIDSGAGTHIGQLTDALMTAGGTTANISITTTTGVWIEGFTSADANKIIYTDSTGATHTPPASVAVVVNFDAAVASAGGQVSVFSLDGTYTDATYTPAHIAGTLINEAASGTSASTSLTYSSDIPVRVVVRAPGLQQFSLYTTVTSSGLTVAAQTPVDGTY